MVYAINTNGQDSGFMVKRTTVLDRFQMALSLSNALMIQQVEEDEEESGQDEVVPKMSRREAEQKRMAEIEKGRAAKKKAHQQEVRRDLWDAVRQREENLAQADQELELQRAKMSNSIGGVTKQGKKFKIRERKR
jgi:U3 small nucleolar RNA-associated protein 11